MTILQHTNLPIPLTMVTAVLHQTEITGTCPAELPILHLAYVTIIPSPVSAAVFYPIHSANIHNRVLTTITRIHSANILRRHTVTIIIVHPARTILPYYVGIAATFHTLLAPYHASPAILQPFKATPLCLRLFLGSVGT